MFLKIKNVTWELIGAELGINLVNSVVYIFLNENNCGLLDKIRFTKC